MSAKESVQILKEQLKLKNLELKKRDADQIKLQEKVKQVLALNDRKVFELSRELEKKSEGQPVLSGSFPMDEEIHQRVEIREVVVQDPGLVQAVNELKNKNKELSNQINHASNERTKITKERELMLKEIRRLRESPDGVEKLKTKLQLLETRFKELQARNKALISEKMSLSGMKGPEQGAPEGEQENIIFAAGTPAQLMEDYSQLKKENVALTEKLKTEAKKFELKLNRELDKLRDELDSKSNKIRRGRRRENITDEHGGAAGVHAPFWMITFSDFSALLLTFFILLYTMAAKNISVLKTAILGDENASIGMLELLDSVEMKERIKDLTGLKSKDILKEVTKVAQSKDFESQVSVSTDQAKIILRVPGNTLFQPGKAVLQKEARPVLDELIKSVKTFPEYKINIQGHTDDSPISSDQFATNWELSATRATAVLRYFLDKGIEPTRLTATGFADIFPLASNDTEAGRSQNRRVEIVLEKEK